MSKPSNDIRIYLKASDKARMADCRVRIVRETNPREPCDNEELVFEKAEDEDHIPENALYKWKFQPYGHEYIWFFTTAERCKKMVAEDPSYWTLPKLKEFAEIEGRIYRNWHDGHVYGIIIEKWDEKQREWKTIATLGGMYGAAEALYNINNELDLLYDELDRRANIPICIDKEDMKYEFDNTEKEVNEFDDDDVC